MRKILLALSVFAFTLNAIAQDNPWQQQADTRGILPPLFQRFSAK